MVSSPLPPRDSARLFLALWPGHQERRALSKHQQAWHWNPASSLMRPNNLHLTLHFIGQVPRQRLPLMRQALGVACAPFDLQLGLPELWPHGIAVLRPLAIPDALAQLYAALGEALTVLDLPPPARDFRPHVTLARRAQGAAPPLGEAPIDWPVRGYALVESLPGSASDYQVLQSYGCTSGPGTEAETAR